MPSLPEQLGREYVDQFYRHALFRMGDDVLMYRKHITANEIQCYAVDKRRFEWTDKVIPSKDVASMDTFQWPKLGYRQFQYKKGVFSTSYLSMQRSAMRGLKDELVLCDKVGDAILFQSAPSMRDAMGAAKFAWEIFNPTFTPFDEGVQLIRDGNAICVALNEDVALSFSATQGPNRVADVIYRQKVIGEVRPDGEVVVPHKIARKSAHLFGRRLRV